jgi:hypothetical protein
MGLLLVVPMERETINMRKGHGELDFFSFMRKKRYGGPAFPQPREGILTKRLNVFAFGFPTRNE